MAALWPPDVDDLVILPDEVVPLSIVREDQIQTVALASNQLFRGQRTYWSSTSKAVIPAYDGFGPIEETIFQGHCTFDPDGPRDLRVVMLLVVMATMTVEVIIGHGSGPTTETVTGITTSQVLALTLEDIDPGPIDFQVRAWHTAGASASVLWSASMCDRAWPGTAPTPSPALPAPSND